jgi:protein-S-isoprenylcysteine O-methyltransferase Ste14
MYARLARREEREVRAEFGAEYDRYAANSPAFLPRLRGIRPQVPNVPQQGASV